MKRVIVVSVILVLVFALTACNQATPAVPSGAVRGVDRIGVLDAGGQGITTWGGNFDAYSDQGTTQSFGVVGATGNVYVKGTQTFEGSTNDAFETTLGVVDPTVDNSILLPNMGGTVMLGGSATKTIFG